MSSMVTIDIYLSPTYVCGNTKIPDNYNIRRMLDELINVLKLPRLDDKGELIEYTVYLNNDINPLSSSAIVADSLHNGDKIRLEAKSNGKTVNLTPVSDAAIPLTIDDNLEEITVVLSIQGSSPVGKITLSTTRPVGELIKQIVSKYNLPTHDESEPIRYELASKTLGDKELLKTATLGQLRVPPLDHLTLSRQYEAGVGRTRPLRGRTFLA